METIKYSVWTGLLKTAKNSAILLVPFIAALLAGMPEEYALITGPVIYFLNNLYQNKIK